MKIITKNISIEKKLLNIEQKKDFLFFDIETSGLNKKYSNIYLIACAFFIDENTICLKQFFASEFSKEKEILENFVNLASKFTYLISFNGDRFDIPFIKACLKLYFIDFDIDKKNSIDLYKIICKYKKFFYFEKLNQSSIEKYLAINREDKYSGKELINIYQHYLENKNDISLLNKLLLHNECDILGLIQIIQFLDFENFISSNFSFVSFNIKEKFVKISFVSDCSSPFDLKKSSKYLSLEIEKNNLSIYLDIEKKELKYFLDNYKDYFYLPKEDITIHKDLAQFVDKNAKIKSKKETAFIKKETYFVKDCLLNTSLKKFSETYNSNEHFLDLNDIDFKLEAQNILDYTLKFFINKA